MKFFAAVALIALNFVLIACHEDNIMSLQKQAVTECRKEHIISPEAVKSIVNREDVPEGPGVKCWIRCVLEKLEVMKDGKLDWQRCNSLTKHSLDNDEDKTKVDKITEICQREVSNEEEDKCQLAYLGTVCKINNWKKFGLPVKKLMD